MSNLFDLNNKAVFITDGSRGLGAQFAKVLAQLLILLERLKRLLTKPAALK